MKEMDLPAVQAPTDAEQLADAAVATWHDVWIALSPVIGTAGVTALFQRSVFLRMAEYPWLANVGDSSPAGGFNSLRRELSQHRQADAAAANAALLQSLARVLGNLIGASLTTRLLQSVFEKHGRTTQDTSAQ